MEESTETVLAAWWWLPLAVSVGIALISAITSYLTARHSLAREAQRELLAYKRIQYLEIQKAISQYALELATSNGLKQAGLDPLESLQETGRKAMDALVALDLIAPKKIRDLRTSKLPSEGDYADLERLVGPVRDLMVEDIEQSARRLVRW